MKKTTKAAIFVTAAAALYGAAAYGVTRTLMDVAMKREAPKAFKNKGSAQLTGEKRDESYREAQRAAAKKLASSETETVLLENREGLTLVGHLRECEKAKRLVIAFHGWRSAWYRDFVPLKMAFENRDACAAPCKLLVVPGADHAMSYYMGRGAYEAAVRAFWERFDK